jgi:hypothetical protein
MGTKKKRELRVVEIETKAIVHTLDVTDRSDREVERIELGMLRNMNTEKFYIEDSGCEGTVHDGD